MFTTHKLHLLFEKSHVLVVRHNNLYDLHCIKVWSLYTEGRSMELIDASCAESCHLPEAIRLITVALLCVQQKAGDRPNMSSVVLMMDGEGELTQPKKPSFFIEKEFPVGNFSKVAYTGCSLNDISITEADGR
ncbi:putative non-specific serine/threonine protein kinase [Helianthus anomalus]